ncbi:MAG: pirin family protein [Pseudomonadota bacterium]
MTYLRRTEERGSADFGWLQSRHSFSFGQYYDPNHMGFSDLRVINQDVVAPGAGFGTHPHENMEILTYVLEGALKHVDSMGNERTLSAGEFQRMTAGTGVTHSEMNASQTDPVHFLQIWVEPNENGLAPSYEELSLGDVPQGVTLIAAPEAREGQLSIHQDTRIFAGKMDAAQSATLEVDAGRRIWVQGISGGVVVNGQQVRPGDGLALEGVDTVSITVQEDAQFLVFDLR